MSQISTKRATKFSLKLFNYIKIYFISAETFVCFQIKKASFNSFVDKDWLGKVMLILFKNYLNSINGSEIFFVYDGPIFAKYLLNWLAISSWSVFISLSILSFWGKFDLLICFAWPIISLITVRLFVMSYLNCSIFFWLTLYSLK